MLILNNFIKKNLTEFAFNWSLSGVIKKSPFSCLREILIARIGTQNFSSYFTPEKVVEDNHL